MADPVGELTDSFSHKKMSDYGLVVAIQFGTNHSGYAYSNKSNKEDIRMHSQWGTCVGISQAFKTPTCVLTDKDGKFEAFGFEAQARFSNMTQDEAADYHFFERFKIHPHNKSTISRTTYLTAHGGQVRSALEIFAMSLAFLKDHFLKTIDIQVEEGVLCATKSPSQSHALDACDNFFRWVITIPAIWTDASKQFMREAAKEAGMIKTVTSQNLIIVLEPEAASLYCRSLDLRHFVGSEKTYTKITEGTKYLVLDCGGETFDVTAYHLLPGNKVAQLYQANGGNLGGDRIDKNFVNMLQNIFGKAVVQEYQLKCPADWLQMMSNFECMKRGIDPDKVQTTNVPISYEFAELYMDVTGKTIRQSVPEEYKKKGVVFASGMLRLPHEIVLGLFKPIVNAIAEHVQELMKEPQLKQVTHLLVVGGFGESLVLQDVIKRHFKRKFNVLVPQEASLCVVKGAVTFGHFPDAIVVRRARKTCGTDVYPRYDPEKHSNPDKKEIMMESCEQREYSASGFNRVRM